MEQSARQKVIMAKAQETQESHFRDTCKKKAKVIANIKFGLDPLTDIIPKDFKKKTEYMAFWKELTEKYITEGSEPTENDTK